MTFFRTSEREAQERPDLAVGTVVAGVRLYVHKSLAGHFAAQPLILTTRGPRLAIEKDAGLAALEQSLLRELQSKRDDP